MGKQEEVNNLIRLLILNAEKGIHATARYLVEHGIRSKNGFKLIYEDEDREGFYGTIQPKQYKDEDNGEKK